MMLGRVAAIWLSWVMVFSCIVIIVEIAEPVRGATITVDDSGGADYTTIQEGIDAANVGDTVFVYIGIYYENLIVEKTLSLFGESRDNTIINGTSEEDVILILSDGTSISNFTLIGSGLNESQAGIELKYIQNCNIDNNIIINNFQGINVNNSNNNLISNNNISFNGVGIILNSSINNNIMNNVMFDDGIVIGGDSIEHWNSHEIDTTNSVNGKPVYYWKNENSGTIPSNAGQIILANCRNIVIENQEINYTSAGIELGFSNDNIIQDNTVSYNGNGLSLISSSKNTINRNTISGNEISISLSDSNENNIHDNYISESPMGMLVTLSNENLINANNISNNDEGIWIIGSEGNIIEGNIISNKENGIWLMLSNETIIRANKITRNIYGIYLLVSDRNNISENIISNNLMGIYFWINGSWNNITLNLISNNSIGIIIMGFIFVNPENNFIYHNSFINNTNQSFDTSINGNKWDNGYPSGGNYWDDYIGSDKKSGPNQDISGYDGLGDTPYEIDSDSFDNYPLIKPMGEDFIPPSIELISPYNNAVITPGTIIDLSVSDGNLDKVLYSINEGSFQEISAPYDVDTDLWEDGDYTIHIQAEDSSNNIETASYNFIVDSTPPEILLESPTDGSFVGFTPVIDFSVSDENLDEVLYSINSGSQLQIFDPYIINGNSWQEGEIIIEIYAYDLAGNANDETFVFIKDISPPEITLNSPLNESYLGEITTINFEITDDNINSVSYSINQDSFQTFEEPYVLGTSDWNDGEYIITIRTEDKAGNNNERWFSFKKDTTSPSIDTTSIKDNDIDVNIETGIIIQFSESMNIQSVEDALSITPSLDFSCSWTNDNKTLAINYDGTLDYETPYKVSISTKAKDLADRGLEEKFELEFTTEARPIEKNGDGFPVLFLLLALLVVVILVVLILVMVMSKKKKAPVGGVDTDLFGGVTQTPQTIHITCYNCHNPLQVTDIGITQYVTCPYCSINLTVISQVATHATQSQYPSQPQYSTQPPAIPQSQPHTKYQQPTLQISCPKCQYRFSVVKSQGPIRVQCPNCGTQGTLG